MNPLTFLVFNGRCVRRVGRRLRGGGSDVSGSGGRVGGGAVVTSGRGSTRGSTGSRGLVTCGLRSGRRGPLVGCGGRLGCGRLAGALTSGPGHHPCLLRKRERDTL